MIRNKLITYVILATLYVILVPTVSAQTNSFDSFFQWLTGGIQETHVDQDVQKVNNASLPFGARISPVAAPIEDLIQSPEPSGNVKAANTVNKDPVLNAAGQYKVGAGILTPQNKAESSSINVWDVLKTLFTNPASLVDYGNKKADDYLSTKLPDNKGIKVLESESELIYSLKKKQQTELPFAAAQALENQKIAPFESPTPTPTFPTGENSPTPTPTKSSTPLPDDPCNGLAYCSKECLSQFWTDQESVEIASYICTRESGGDPFALNDNCLNSTDGINNEIKYKDEAICIDLADTEANGCLKPQYDGATVDFSVGLFQINILAHCSAAKPELTWTPPTCTFGSISGRDVCQRQLENYVENIQKAVAMSSHGNNWRPWCGPKSPEWFCKQYFGGPR